MSIFKIFKLSFNCFFRLAFYGLKETGGSFKRESPFYDADALDHLTMAIYEVNKENIKFTIVDDDTIKSKYSEISPSFSFFVF